MRTCRVSSITKLFALLCVAVCGLAQAQIPPSERAVLDTFYTQTNGASWTNSKGWEGAAGTECNWFGIGCDSTQSHVTSIYFPDNNLSGTLPPLTALTSLQTFVVDANQLTGNVPVLTGLTDLQTCDVSGNQLTGSIPALAGLTNLQRFVAASNQFTGSVPTLTGLTNLQYFYVYNNQLTGSIPTLAGLTNLLVFDASGNQLTGSIPALTGLSSLQQFVVYSNNLTGGIPTLTALSNLQSFDVDTNQLTGSIPYLTGLSSLLDFNVGGNQLTGSIPSLTGLSSLQTLYAYHNQLTGAIPSLAGLTNLSTFDVDTNQLTGSIPSLTGLTNLQYFFAYYNQLTGSIPNLTGLSSLVYFDVYSNQLSGSIPSLTGLPLQHFQVGNNGLTGDIPTPPASLLADGSSLCNNALTATPNSAWDTATGVSPWYSTCTLSPSILTITTADTTVATGTSTTITATITTAAAAAAGGADASSSPSMGTVTITDSNGNLICYIALDSSSTGSCTVVLPSGTTTLIGGYSGSLTLAPATAQFTKTNPVTVAGNLDQHGWTGAWYNPATGGQGVLFEIYPDLISPGIGYFGGSMFTYDTTAGGEDHKRWYTLTGNVSSSSPTTTLNIAATGGGNFNAGPIINTADGENFVGHATLSFSDCTDGNLSYSFTDGTGRVGNIPLKRLDRNVTCDPTNGNGNGTAPGLFLLSGAWYDRSTSGQGLLFDINPVENVTFAAWYTYAPNGQATGGGASQRWYTLQLPNLPSANAGAAALTNIPIYSAQGGIFNAPGGVTNPQEGSANITFSDCNDLVLSYSFTSGTNTGLSGTINLVRVGPAPAGCDL